MCLHRRQLHFTGFQGNNLIALVRRLQALETQTRIHSRIKPSATGGRELITRDDSKISSPVKEKKKNLHGLKPFKTVDVSRYIQNWEKLFVEDDEDDAGRRIEK